MLYEYYTSFAPTMTVDNRHKKVDKSDGERAANRLYLVRCHVRVAPPAQRLHATGRVIDRRCALVERPETLRYLMREPCCVPSASCSLA
jgi:hypothetical protein